jgi:hypothetical protein
MATTSLLAPKGNPKIANKVSIPKLMMAWTGKRSNRRPIDADILLADAEFIAPEEK